MGKIENGYIKGLVGTVVTRRVGDTQVVQSKGRLRKKGQTPATKAAAMDFGTASKCARMIRYAFWELILGFHDPFMMNRLNQQVLRAMRANTTQQRGALRLADGNLTKLKGFQFNAKCPLDDHLFADIGTRLTDGNLRVMLAEFNCDRDLVWPETATRCTIRTQVFGFDFSADRMVRLGNEALVFPLRTRTKRVGPTQWTFTVNVPEGTVVAVGMSIEFDREMGTRPFLLNSKACHPVALIDVFSV